MPDGPTPDAARPDAPIVTYADAPFADLGSLDAPCRLLEIIAPAGFERMFARIAADPSAMAGDGAAAVDADFGLDVDYASVERLCTAHGLDCPG